MKPPEMFEGWVSWRCWSIAIHLDFQFKRISVMLGPFGGAIYWGNL